MLFVVNSVVFFFNFVMFSRAIARFKNALASLRGLFSMSITIFIVLFYYFGGILSVESPPGPFLICIGLMVTHAIILIVLISMK